MPRQSTIYTFRGISAPLGEHARRHSLTLSTVEKRLRKGWSLEKALTEPSRHKIILIEAFGVRKSLGDHAREHGIDRGVVFDRMRNGWDVERALSTPLIRRDACWAQVRTGNEYVVARTRIPWRLDIEAQRIVRENPDGMHLTDIAAVFGMTRERVRQIEEVALRKLRNTAAGRALLATWLAKSEFDRHEPYGLRG